MLTLNPIFQNGAVFQQNITIPVWGKASPGAILKAEFAGVESSTKALPSGNFTLRLPPVKAGGPYTLKITDISSGENAVADDILVGEVWVASGQSNMAYQLGPAAKNEDNVNMRSMQAKEYCDTVKDPSKIRFIVVPKNASGLEEDSFSGEWKYMTAENAPEASAVAAWFAKFVADQTDIPVGLIVSSWGGTYAEAWTSRSGLLSNPETESLVYKTDLIFHDTEVWKREFSAPPVKESSKDPGNRGVEWGWAKQDFDDSSWNEMQIPGSWIKQKISGNGAIWARKEINIPSDWAEKDLILQLGGIDKQDITYFNGEKIGETGKGLDTSFWDTPRVYKIPAKLVHPGRNTIAVRAYSFVSDGAFLGRENKYCIHPEGSDQKINISGAWKAAAELDLGVFYPAGIFHGPGNPDTPGILFDGMIRPILHYAIRGVVWYQGENHTGTVSEALAYKEKLETLIRDWRYHWGQGDFPFIQTQIANFSPDHETAFVADSSWALLRDSQRTVCRSMQQVYMCTAIDAGELDDIHPQDKKTVGKRMALCALHHVYKINKVIPSGPVYEDHTIEGNAMRINFSCAEGMTVNTDLPQSFYIAGEDRIFHPATSVKVDGCSLLVSCDRVHVPCAVRYAWSSAPESTLRNAAGLPASSFRTDCWDFV